MNIYLQVETFLKRYYYKFYNFLNINLCILIRGSLLYNIVLVLPYIDMNPPQVYMCSLPLPSPSHPSGSSQCTSPKHPYHASNLDWRSISHMIIYMFQCHSPKSPHSCPLLQSPKDCSIHLCLFCCLTYRYFLTSYFCIPVPYTENDIFFGCDIADC